MKNVTQRFFFWGSKQEAPGNDMIKFAKDPKLFKQYIE